MKNATPRQMEILRYIRRFTRDHGYSPTMQEIGDHLGLNKVTVYEHVGALVKKGLLNRGARHKARSLQVSEDFVFPEDESDETGLPFLGRIAAGGPVEAFEDSRTMNVGELFPPDGDTFILEVGGDSMIDDHICEGDFAVCRRTSTAHDGDIVVALLDDGETTLKRFFREKNRIRLQPANDAYQPIYTENVQIQGVLTGVIRQT